GFSWAKFPRSLPAVHKRKMVIYKVVCSFRSSKVHLAEKYKIVPIKEVFITYLTFCTKIVKALQKRGFCGFKFYFCKEDRTYDQTVATTKAITEIITSANSTDEVAANTYGQPGRKDKRRIGRKPCAGSGRRNRN